MFRTKPNTTTIVVAKNPKLDNVPVNVVVVVTMCSQTSKQHVLRERELMMEKTTINW
jgi:hypothetical protein